MSLVDEALGDIISFSRASSATRTNASGALENVAANQPRFDFEPSDIPILGPELVANGGFDSAVGWTLSGGVSVSGGEAVFSAANFGSARQNLTLTEGKLYLVESICSSRTSGGYAISFFGGNNIYGATRLSPGSYSEVLEAKAGNTNVRVVGMSASDSLSVTSISVREITGYIARKGDPNGLLIEEQRTNLCTYSEDFSQSAWTVSACAKTNTSAQDAYGGIKAAIFTLDTQNQSHFILGPSGVSFTAGTIYTASLLIKAGVTNRIQLSFPGAAFGASQYANFSMSGNGSVLSSSGLTAKIEPVANGYYRCHITGTATTTAAGNAVVMCFINADNATRLPGFVGNGADSVTVCFSQVEVGPFATSYIPTTAAQVTRSADFATINSMSPWFNALEGSVVAEFDAIYAAGMSVSPRIFDINDSSSNNRHLLYLPSNAVTYLSSVSGINSANINTGANSGGINKSAIAYATDNFAASLSGNISSDSSGPLPSGLNKLLLGYSNGTTPMCGHIRKLRYFPKRLTNAQLQSLTA